MCNIVVKHFHDYLRCFAGLGQYRTLKEGTFNVFKLLPNPMYLYENEIHLY